MTGFFRAKIYKLLGVSIEKGVVRIGRVSIDTIHPEDIFIGKGTTIVLHPKSWTLLGCFL